MKSFAEQLNKFESLLQLFFRPLYNKLLNPLREDQIQIYLDQLGVDDRNFKEIFNWRNGIPNDGMHPTHSYAFCSYGVIPSIEYIKEVYDLHRSVAAWPKSHVPIITTFGGEFLLFDTNKNSRTDSRILLFSPTLGYVDDNVPSYYDSLYSMIETLNACIENGGFRYSEKDMTLDYDIDIVFEISTRLNPKSEYWDDYR